MPILPEKYMEIMYKKNKAYWIGAENDLVVLLRKTNRKVKKTGSP